MNLVKTVSPLLSEGPIALGLRGGIPLEVPPKVQVSFPGVNDESAITAAGDFRVVSKQLL